MFTGNAITGEVLINGRSLQATAVFIRQDESGHYKWGNSSKEKDAYKLTMAILFELMEGSQASKYCQRFRQQFIAPLKEGTDFEIKIAAIKAWFGDIDPELVIDAGTRSCPKCSGTMTHQSARLDPDSAGWRCLQCGSYIWDNYHNPGFPDITQPKPKPRVFGQKGRVHNV